MKNVSDFFLDNLNIRPEADVYDVLRSSFYEEFDLRNFETDYVWEYWNDPIITPTIIAEWGYLDSITKYWLKGKKSVLTIGGGGTSKTLDLIDFDCETLVILNSSLWDLKTIESRDQVDIFKIRGIGEKLPFKNKVFDAIEIPATIDHLNDPTQCLKEVGRVLKDNGILIITCGNQTSWYRELMKKMHFTHNEAHHHAHTHHFSPEGLQHFLEISGLEMVNLQTTAFLKLPKIIERRLGNKILLKLHFLISNGVLRRILGRNNGGMIHVVGKVKQNF